MAQIGVSPQKHAAGSTNEQYVPFLHMLAPYGLIQQQRNQKLLIKVERIALKMITRCMPSTPTIALNQITNIPTIIEFIEGEAAKGHLRLQAINQLTSEKPIKTRSTIISHTYHNNN